MGNVYCQICDEPWDSYLDMSEWEKVLFRQGKGCPCCGGRGESTVEWEAPPPEPVEGCECEHCHVKAGFDADGEAVWIGGDKVHYSHGVAGSYGSNYGDEDADDYTDPEAWNTLYDKTYCPGCSQVCWDCDNVLLKGDIVQWLDFEDAGYPHPIGGWYSTRAVCGECHDKRSFESLQESLDGLERSLPSGLELDPTIPEDWQSQLLQENPDTHHTEEDDLEYVDEDHAHQVMISLGFVVCEECGNTIREREVRRGENTYSRRFRVEHFCPSLAEELAEEA